MKGPIIICNATKKAREQAAYKIISEETGKKLDKKALEKLPDVLIIKREKDKKSVGISQAREVIKFLQEKPFSLKRKGVIIFEAEKLTTEAQNALLKTLEEPPSYAVIILDAKTINSLLPTVVSRCRKIHVEKDKEEIEDEDAGIAGEYAIEKVLKMNTGQRLEWVEELAKEDREVVEDILEKWVADEREIMINPKTGGNLQRQKAANIKKILEIKEDIEKTNVNLRLGLEVLMFWLS